MPGRDHTEAGFDRLTLSFPKDLEEEFRRDYSQKSVLHVRVGIGFAIALWSLFGLLDPWIVPEVKAAAWLIRFAVVVPSLLLIFLFTFSRHYYRLAQPAAATASMISALALIAIVNIVIRPGGAHPYTAGMLLSVPCVCVVWRLRFVKGAWAQAQLGCGIHRLGAAAGAEHTQDRGKVRLDRALGNVQLAGDDLVRFPLDAARTTPGLSSPERTTRGAAGIASRSAASASRPATPGILRSSRTRS